MGEEPDGQYMLPEDYGALYLQFATALHRIDPALKLGGPVFEGVNEDIHVWPDAQGKTSWLGRFIDYLKAHGRLGDLAFMSFEHYPFEPCKIQWSSLYDEPTLISHILRVWRDDGLPPEIPVFITELNIAWATGESFVDIFGGLWLADYVGAFLTAGGDGLYYFHYLPSRLHGGCNESVRHLRDVHGGCGLRDPAADVAVLRQPVIDAGMGATRGRRRTASSRPGATFRIRQVTSWSRPTRCSGRMGNGRCWPSTRTNSTHIVSASCFTIESRCGSGVRGPDHDDDLWQRAVPVASERPGRSGGP